MKEFSKKITGTVEVSIDRFEVIEKEIKNIADFKEKITTSFTQNITEILEIILGGALILNSSDIHIETKENLIR